jgi:uncharacterized protein (TIGR00299 family) protein
MRAAYLEATFGLSGDKVLGALLDAGADLDGLNSALSALGIGLSVEAARVTKGPVAALQATVDIEAEQPQRSWAQIESLIRESPLDATVIDDACAIFERLAQAEAEVHGTDPAHVRFHELGAADSIADIVGCAWCLHDLGIEYLACSEVTTGSGTTASQHGTLPVPAPATSILLQGVPTRGGEQRSEMTTPTGAALVATLAKSFGPPPTMTVESIGTGAGTRELDVPNVCRAFVGETESVDALSAGIDSQVVVSIATTLDDITPEHLAYAAEQLLEAGALDVWRAPVSMKKDRLGTTLEVLARPEDATELSDLTMQLSGSPGVRMSVLSRRVAGREIVEIESPWGPAHVKVARLPGRLVTHAEYDDVARIARENSLAPEDVARTLEGLAREGSGEAE